MLSSEAIIYEEHVGKTYIEFNKEYLGKKGVWTLYGKKNEDDEYICLNVGKSVNVGEEILLDLSYLHFVLPDNKGSKEYINQFEEGPFFKYQGGKTREYLYPYIAKKYNYLQFRYVADENNLKTESKYAKENHALLWRNGKPYLRDYRFKIVKKYVDEMNVYSLLGGTEGAPKDEFDMESSRIAERIYKGINENEVASIICNVFKESFGLETPVTSYIKCAEKIVKDIEKKR